jgi:hypothetical protein
MLPIELGHSRLAPESTFSLVRACRVRTGIFYIRRKSRDTDQARANGKSDLVVCKRRGANTFLPYFDNIALTASLYWSNPTDIHARLALSVLRPRTLFTRGALPNCQILSVCCKRLMSQRLWMDRVNSDNLCLCTSNYVLNIPKVMNDELRASTTL